MSATNGVNGNGIASRKHYNEGNFLFTVSKPFWSLIADSPLGRTPMLTPDIVRVCR